MVRGFFVGFVKDVVAISPVTTQGSLDTTVMDSHIPVFGHAGDRTLNQIRVCARTSGVTLCAKQPFGATGVPIPA